MRLMISAVFVLAGTAGAYAASECPLVGQEVLSVERWSIEDTGEGEYLRYSLEVSLLNNSAKPVVMTDGEVQFYDLLDRYIASAFIDPDLAASPGEVAAFTDRLRESDAYRLPDLDPAQVSTVICLNSVAYADGTVERFPIAR